MEPPRVVHDLVNQDYEILYDVILRREPVLYIGVTGFEVGRLVLGKDFYII